MRQSSCQQTICGALVCTLPLGVDEDEVEMLADYKKAESEYCSRKRLCVESACILESKQTIHAMMDALKHSFQENQPAMERDVLLLLGSKI